MEQRDQRVNVYEIDFGEDRDLLYVVAVSVTDALAQTPLTDAVQVTEVTRGVAVSELAARSLERRLNWAHKIPYGTVFRDASDPTD